MLFSKSLSLESILDVQEKTVIKFCDEVLKEIEGIIIEAEQTFSFKL